MTRMELAVLKLLADGRKGKQVAAELGISYTTVKTHVEHIFHRLGARNATNAVAIAMRRNLIT